MRGKRKKNRGPSGEVRGVDQVYDEGTTFDPHLKAAILEVVENQILVTAILLKRGRRLSDCWLQGTRASRP